MVFEIGYWIEIYCSPQRPYRFSFPIRSNLLDMWYVLGFIAIGIAFSIWAIKYSSDEYNGKDF